MNRKHVWLVVGLLIGFIGGFFVANTLNRNQIDELLSEKAKLTRSNSGNLTKGSESELSENEINEKIAEAKNSPKDFTFQKGLGLALYRYAARKQDADLLAKVVTLLERAHNLNKDDYQVIVSLGNVNFDLGQINNDSVSNLRAREFYEKALAKNPKDINVVTDYGLTYLLTEKRDINRAIAELQKALEQNPKSERTLQYMTKAQIETKNAADASDYLARLKVVNPRNVGLPELEASLQKIK